MLFLGVEPEVTYRRILKRSRRAEMEMLSSFIKGDDTGIEPISREELQSEKAKTMINYLKLLKKGITNLSKKSRKTNILDQEV